MNRVWNLLRDGMDRATIYLPIILTAAVALSTYWLVRNAPKLLEPEVKVAPTHEPDYFMRDFVIKNFLPDGSLRSELFGKEGRHFPDTDTLEVDQVRMRAISPEGVVTRSTANRGLSNSDGSEVQLFGNAIVIRDPFVGPDGKPSPQLEFHGEYLHTFLDTERVTSNLPVTLIRGTDKFTGDTLDYDNLSGVANLHGRVRGLLVPAATSPAAAPPPAASGGAKPKR